MVKSEIAPVVQEGCAECRSYEARLIDALAARQRMEQQAAQSNVDWLAVRARLAEAEAARSITRATLTDARRFVVMTCGDSSPTVKIMLARIDKALAESEFKAAANASTQESDDAK